MDAAAWGGSEPAAAAASSRGDGHSARGVQTRRPGRAVPARRSEGEKGGAVLPDTIVQEGRGAAAPGVWPPVLGPRGIRCSRGRGPWSRPPERPPAPPLASVLRPQGGCRTSGRGVCVPGGKESGVRASWLSGRAGCGVRGGGGYYLSLELNLCFHLSQNVPLWFQDRLGSTGLGVPPAPASLRLPEDAFSSRPGSWALPPAPPPTPIPAPQGLPHSPPPAWEVRGTERPVGVSACPGPGSPRLALAPDMLCPQGCLQRRPEVPSARRQAAAPRWAADALRLCGDGGRGPGGGRGSMPGL